MKPNLALVFALVAGCSHSSSTTSTEIGATGGTVSGSDGTSVTIPPGALSTATNISVGDETATVTIANAVLVGHVYRFGPEGTQFSAPVTVILAYDPGKLPAGATASDVVIMTAPVGSQSFTPLTTSIADATHVSASTSHFSDFVATAPLTPRADAGTQSDLASADLSAVSDASVPRDLSGVSVVDLAKPRDLDEPPDLSEKCQPAWNPMVCTESAAAGVCGSSAYSLNCEQTVCLCSGANMNKVCPKPAPYTNTTMCPTQQEVATMWTSCCDFP